MEQSTPDPVLPNRSTLRHHLPERQVIESQIDAALAEDMGAGDLTAALLPAGQRARAELITREPATLCGCAWFETVFRRLDPASVIRWEAEDGDRIVPGQRLCVLEGASRALLTGERTAMNYLQALAGTATRARQYADAVAGLPVRVLDTRKTLPGLRLQQKYAVLCGGCHNHRIGLFDAILIKENHILAAGSIRAALEAARALNAGVGIEIEVESLAELEQALDAGAELVLLDNFTLEELRRAVALNAGRARLEASGGIDLKTVRPIAETGVDRISVGALTKDVTAVDLSMRLVTL
ncbi:carboxylating nicotinate-nucleotide diphosphorylase [Thiocystis violascens]|uniref:nicotinate-nucleotide diphosphorylase (carboxylating) n=1 Tax=Thiocystis violascens (strain ATCC 17096 / DSM 198 / 6111) TaxID=765911 RepID=I3YDA6_THIV6|nr:carboxylating nicotinate-nucleotide diphosphorylase [Thiocystis violascens]AFL74974.1 nicotinate-nucleotide pyrophosphorylase (carboxylating) [Thiocystis violascens DSM 198]